MKLVRRHAFTLGYVTSAVAVAAVIAADMWADPNYQFMANVALLAIAGLVAAFWVWSDWRSSQLGFVFLRKCITLTAVMALAAMAAWWDQHFPGRQHLRFAVFTLGALWYAPMLIVLVRTIRRSRRARAAADADT